MSRKSLMTILITASLAASAAWAQPPDPFYPGDERPRQDRWQGDRLNRIVEYLELSDPQATEWQAITEQHFEILGTRKSRIEALRNDFRELADQQKPNLEQLGQIALELHREQETTRSSRGQLKEELEKILTPGQAERFEALAAAREFSGPGGRHGRREGWSPPDSD